MGIQVLHKFLEIIAYFQIGHHFSYLPQLFAGFLLFFCLGSEVFLGTAQIYFYIFDFSGLFSSLNLQIAYFLVRLKSVVG